MFPIGICTDFVSLPELQPLGFDFVELPLCELAALTEAEFQEFAAYADGTGLKALALNRMLPDALPVTGPRVNATELHGYLNHAFGRARRLGAKLVTLDASASRSVPEEVDFPFAWRQLGNFLRLVQGHAKESGLTVCLEPIRKSECNLLNLVSEATLIAGLLQLDNIAVAAHSGHMAMASEPLSALRRAAPLLRHVHVENALTRRLPRPDDGESYDKLADTLANIGYAGGLSLCGGITDDFIREAAEALKLMRAVISLNQRSC